MARALRECVDAEKGSGMGTERVPGMVRRGIETVPSLGEGGGRGMRAWWGGLPEVNDQHLGFRV